MERPVVVVLIVACFFAFSAATGDRTEAEKAVDAVLSGFHQAASDADGDLYFSLLAKGAVFMGTDATERWSVEELEAFARPYFSEGRGWTYTKTQRHVYVAADGLTAWFDEMLWNATYGTCRGTGVLVRTDNEWRIAQYSLSIPIPNDLARDFTRQIRDLKTERDH